MRALAAALYAGVFRLPHEGAKITDFTYERRESIALRAITHDVLVVFAPVLTLRIALFHGVTSSFTVPMCPSVLLLK